ncbi:MAG: sugar ABC transporter permease [Firmicutes bacterium]|nr:sugar ABC transporter permease [Bacillota bacterium]
MEKNKFFKSNLFIASLFLLPAVIFSLVYLISPIPFSAFYSFFKWNGIGKGIFIGWKNWVKLIHDEIFWLAVANNFKLVFISLVGQIPPAIILAVLLTRKIKGANLFKTIYFVPMLISSIAVAILWRYMYDPTFGLINGLLSHIGLDSLTNSWLGNPDIAFYSVAVPIQWRFLPLYIIIFMAAISGIPTQLYEAAKIDGANSLQAFFKITLPLLRPTIINAAVLVIVGSLQYFAMVFTLTGGGPNHASELMATYMYQKAFKEMNMGYGSTISMGLFIIAFTTSIIFLRLSRKNSHN